MGYHTLRPFHNFGKFNIKRIFYTIENIPMIVLSLGSTGYLTIIL